MVLTDAQIAQLREIVADYHTAFTINFFGPTTVPPDVVARLKEKGLVTLQGTTAQDAYIYGRVLQQLNTPQAAQMSFGDFQKYVRANPIPLSPIEEHAVKLAASRGAQYVVGLGNTVAQDTGRIAIEADAQLRRLMKESIKTTVSQGIAERKTVKDIKSNLGHLTKDWTRDLDRIAATEVSLAMNEGMATEVRAQHGDEAEVAVRSRRGCCPECDKAYKGIDGAPIIFRLTDLEANGTNYKKKKADKLPVVPPYHPNCACALVHVPNGHGFTEDNRMSPLGKRGIRPHADVTKSMLALGEQLNKAHPTHREVLDWAGLRLRSLKKLNSEGHYACALLTPAGAVPCLIGPNTMASDAYVAHLPTGDHVMLAFPHAHSAALALNAHHQDKAMMSFPGHGEWSTIPVHELAGWAAAGPSDMFVMAGVGGSAGARPDDVPLMRSTTPTKPKHQAQPDGRLMMPVVPPARHPTPLIASPYEVVPSLSTPEGESNRRVKKVPKTAPWALPPRVQPMGKPTFILGQESPPDPEFKAVIAHTARRRTHREPVTDIEVTP